MVVIYGQFTNNAFFIIVGNDECTEEDIRLTGGTDSGE